MSFRIYSRAETRSNYRRVTHTRVSQDTERHGRTDIESVIEWWVSQVLMGPDAREHKGL